MIRKLKEQKFVWMWGSLLALLLLAAAFPQFLASHDPELVDLGNKLQGASRAYPLGTDHMGRCVLCRLLYGAHTSLFVAGATVLITAFTGTVIGMVSGYYGGIADTLLMRLTDVFLGFYVFNAFLQFVIGYIGHTTGAQIEADIRQELFEHIQELSFSFFDRNKVGELMAHMRSDLYELTELAHHGPEDLKICMLISAGSLWGMIRLNWKLSLGVAVLLPVTVIFIVFREHKMLQTVNVMKEELANVRGELESEIAGIRVTKAFGNEKFENMRFGKRMTGFVTQRKSITENLQFIIQERIF